MTANSGDSLSRREFSKTVAAAGVSLAIPAPGVFASGSDTIRVAVVGCGERGTVDAVNCLKSAPGVELVAIADLFPDKVEAALAKLRQEVPGQVKVPPERVFLGFDAYEKVLALDDVNLVMLLTPPGLPPRDGRGRRRGGKAPVRREAGGRRPGGRARADRDVRAGGPEGPVSRRGHPAAVRAPVPRAHPEDPGRPDRRADPSGGALDRRHGALALPRPPAVVERHGVAGPVLAAVHLAVRGPLRRAARPQPRRGELGRGRDARSSARGSAAGRSGRGRSSATSSTTSRCATSTRTG